TVGEIGVQPPPQALVEALGAVDVGHRKNDDLELRLDRRGARGPGLVLAAYLSAHSGLRGYSSGWATRARLAIRPWCRSRPAIPSSNRVGVRAVWSFLRSRTSRMEDEMTPTVELGIKTTARR